MDYDPADHVPSTRQVSAAWLACVLMGIAVFGGHWALHRARTVIAAAHAQTAPASPQLCQQHDPSRRGTPDPRHAAEPSKG
jgi:hypothetical protein